MTVLDLVHGKAVREAAVFGHGSRRVGVPPDDAIRRRNPERVFMQRQDLRAASRAASVYPPVRDVQQRLRAR